MDNTAATPAPVGTSAPDDSLNKGLWSPAVLTLAALLALQLLVAIAIGWVDGRSSLASTAADTPLLAFEPERISAVRIDDGAGTAVTLTRRNGEWVLADLGSFPAASDRVDQLLDRLHGLKRPLPTATSAGALKRFRLADDAFERKVTLEVDGNTVATLLLGDSPGFKRLFARPAGETAVYDLDLALSDVSNRRDDWLARDGLRLDPDAITGVAAADWTLSKGAGGWRLEGTDDSIDQTVVSGLIGRIANLGYRGVLGTEDAPEYKQDEPVLELTLALTGGESRSYRISRAKDSADYVLKLADRPYFFKLSELDLEGLLDLDRAKLSGAKPTATESIAGMEATASGGAGEATFVPEAGSGGQQDTAVDQHPPPHSASEPTQGPGVPPVTEKP